MKTDELRKTYLEFFRSKEHRIFSSDSLVPHDDPSLLFTGAGMNQFKSYFLGLKKDVKRATSCQKCLRTADLERVGKTAYHHSFFEMLGNFSFGDYFKEDAIAWGWEFVTKALKLPKEKLWVSVYQDDDEAFNIWKNKIGIPEARIVRMGPEDNFWPANAPKDGPNGPCGPCSEIYVGEVPGKGVEIWNLVFTQFDRQSDGSLKNLPQKNIDTGMGLERTAAVLQGVASNFDTDNFQKIRAQLRTLFMKQDKFEISHENAVMDHMRAVVFSIADGALPSNDGRGYVIRKLIRLGSDHFEKSGTPLARRTFFRLVPVIVDVYGAIYPEIVDKQKTISSIIENEEKAYEESCRRAESTRQGSMAADEYAFMLYDTYGLPTDKIKEKFSKDGLSFDEAKFSKYLDQQRERSRQSSKIGGEIFRKNVLLTFVEGISPTQFLGYGQIKSDAKLVRMIRGEAVAEQLKAGEEGFMIFDRTPFYAESGGQVGDTGVITGENFEAEVLDTLSLEKCVLHKVSVKKGAAAASKTYKLSVSEERRADIMKNHTATHLLHAALRKVLGEHVKQSGSLVAPDYLRFDFTHFKALDAAQLASVEALLNAEVQKNILLDKKVMSKEQAVKEGAIAFFGEKYGDEVRVVTIGDFSKELCGGTHLHSTGEIGLFKIVSEGSIQAGVRRIEAVTGRWAKTYLENESKEIEQLASQFKCNLDDLLPMIKNKKSEVNSLNIKLDKIISRVLDKENLTEKYNDVSIITRFNDKVRTDVFALSISYLKTLSTPFVALFEGSSDGKVFFAAGASPDLVQKGFHSGKIIKLVSEKVGGNGGGRPDYAVGGGKNVSGAREAFELGKIAIKNELDVVLAEKKAS